MLHRVLAFVALTACAERSSFDTALDTADPSLGARATAVEPAILTIETDNGADGRIDRVTESAFDDRGDRVREREDRDGDGAFERVTAFVLFRSDNRVVRIEADEGEDGTVDRVEHRVFDAQGRIWRLERDDDADGTVDQVDETTWSGARRVVTHSGGGIVRKTGYTDAMIDGRVSAVEVDIGADGRAENRMTRSFDAEGRLDEIRTDAGMDGTLDGLTRYAYDADGRLTGIAIDSDADGSIETRITRRYEGFGAELDCRTR